MEDPGYPFIRPVVSAAGVNIDPVPIDQQGMDIDWAQAHFPQARFALLTPAHQSPLGVALSLERRRRAPGGRRSAIAGLLKMITTRNFAIRGNRYRR